MRAKPVSLCICPSSTAICSARMPDTGAEVTVVVAGDSSTLLGCVFLLTAVTRKSATTNATAAPTTMLTVPDGAGDLALRASRGGGGGVAFLTAGSGTISCSCAPHCEQNRASGGFFHPHALQNTGLSLGLRAGALAKGSASTSTTSSTCNPFSATRHPQSAHRSAPWGILAPHSTHV